LPVAELADKVREMIMVLWRKRRRIAEKLPTGKILPAVMVQLKANTRGLAHLKVVKSGSWSAEVWDYSKGGERHRVKLNEKTCTCQEWQHIGKPCQQALAFLTTQKNVDLEQFVHHYFSVEKFQAAYGREIEPLADKSQWPRVHLPFSMCAPLTKKNVGRQRKLRFKSCLERGHRKKGDNHDTNSAPTNGDGNPDNSALTNSKGKKMIRGPVICKRCGEKGHRQASSKCSMELRKGRGSLGKIQQSKEKIQ